MVHLGLAALALAAVVPVQAEPQIVPRPLHVTDQGGAGVRLGDGTAVVTPAGDADDADVARYLAILSHRAGGPRLTIATQENRAPAIRFVRRTGFAPEGYTLDVGAQGATIAASTRTGLLYGAVSLWQLLTAAPDHALARVHIEDAPRFAWRGLVLDSVRHFTSLGEVERTIDWMALHKLNRLQWHLTDDQGWRLEIKRYPRLTSLAAWRTTPPAAGLTPGRYGGFYTQAQVRHIVALAASRGITVVPEIEMPGHATAAILAYPAVGLTSVAAANLGDWGVFPSIYGVDAASFTFLHGVLDEVMALFPSREIAIGGDEAVHKLWYASPDVRARMKALGLKDENALQGWFVGQIGAYLNAHGRRLVGWDEILADPSLSKEDVVLSWHGADGAIAAARAGHDVVMATAPTLYLDNRQSTAPSEPSGRGFVVSLADVYGYDPGDPPHSAGTPGLDTASAWHILGVQGALWSEHIVTDAQLETMALPRAAALAEIGWTATDRRDWPGFVARLPAMMARYAALGLNADDGSVAVQAKVVPHAGRASVTLSRQLALGDVHYTSDGSVPTSTSPVYSGSLDLPLPSRLRAASFAGKQRLSRELDLPLDTVSATHRSSQQLDLCTAMVPLNLAGPANAAYLVDIKNPCWIYRGADLARARHIAVTVAVLPFNFQLADEAAPQILPPTATPHGEFVARHGCEGPVLATVALPQASRGLVRDLVADLPPGTGTSDLCLMLSRPTRESLWALGAVEFRP
ncbi:beta-N-acetylhexosaminidase [uncultured Sphingomonas sp.]|uniref:beta-N-acetylhexosaminidase n=1 Tax=uncultured Sphingomonas sp. TaxID=158754 RepID=UPI0035CC3CE5